MKKFKKAKIELPSAVVSPNYPRIRNKKKFGIKLGAVLLVAVMSGLIINRILAARRHRSPHPIATTTGCSEQILTTASVVMEPSKQKDLLPVVSQIKQLPQFDQDPNCLYVVINYYLSISDGANARSYFDKFQKVYTPETVLSPVLLSPTSIRPKDLQANVEFLEKLMRNSSAKELT